MLNGFTRTARVDCGLAHGHEAGIEATGLLRKLAGQLLVEQSQEPSKLKLLGNGGKG